MNALVRRGIRPLVVGLMALLLTSYVANSQQVSDLPRLAQELARLLSGIQPAALRGRLIAAFGIETLGDAAGEAIIDAAQRALKSRDVRSLADWLQETHDASERTKAALQAINDQLPATPNYSHLAFCAQVTASRGKIERITQTVQGLQQLQQVIQSYLRVMPPLENASTVMHRFWTEAYEQKWPAAYDGVMERTTYGSMATQWSYWTDSAPACSAGVPCAAFLLERAWENWRQNERAVTDKKLALQQTIERYEAFHNHFYAASAERCRSEAASAKKQQEFADEVQALVAESSQAYDRQWDASMESRAQALERQLAQATAAAQGQVGRSATLAMLQSGLALARVAASRNDANALRCAEDMLGGTASDACVEYARTTASSPPDRTGNGSDDACANDPALLSRLQSILSNCSTPKGSICEAARQSAACFGRAAQAAGNCAIVVNEARELQRQSEATAAGACVSGR